MNTADMYHMDAMFGLPTSSMLVNTHARGLKSGFSLEAIDEQTPITTTSPSEINLTTSTQSAHTGGSTENVSLGTKKRPFACQFNCTNTYKSEDTRRRHYRRSHNKEWVLTKRSRQNTLRKKNSLQAASSASLQGSESLALAQQQLVSVDSMSSFQTLPVDSSVRPRVFNKTQCSPYERSLSSTSTLSGSSTGSNNTQMQFQSTEFTLNTPVNHQVAWHRPSQFTGLTQNADTIHDSCPISPRSSRQLFAQQSSQDLFGDMSAILNPVSENPIIFSQDSMLSQAPRADLTHSFTFQQPVPQKQAPVPVSNSVAEFETFLRQLESYSQ